MKTWHIGNSKEKLARAVQVLGALALKDEDDFELVLRKTSYQRSQKQNRRYWAILNEIAEQLAVQGQKFTPYTWHKYFKLRYIGNVEVVMPNGKRYDEPASSSTLDVAEFGEYMTKVEVWAAQHGVLLSDIELPA